MNQFRADRSEDVAGLSEVESLSDAHSDGNSDSSWVDGGHFSHLKVHGYSDMQFFDYTAGGDWAWPSK
jgi:hypothetical protein